MQCTHDSSYYLADIVSITIKIDRCILIIFRINIVFSRNDGAITITMSGLLVLITQLMQMDFVLHSRVFRYRAYPNLINAFSFTCLITVAKHITEFISMQRPPVRRAEILLCF